MFCLQVIVHHKGKWNWNLEVATEAETVGNVTYPLILLAFPYTLEPSAQEQHHLQYLGPPVSVIHQESIPQTYPQTSLMEGFSQLSFLFPR